MALYARVLLNQPRTELRGALVMQVVPSALHACTLRMANRADARVIPGTLSCRACRDHQTLLQWAAMYGVGRRLHSTVQHSLRRVHTLMYNEYLWNGETYYQDSRVQVRDRAVRDRRT